nr:MAG TPA: hypothetical protein [Caudoviricetes sp.]
MCSLNCSCYHVFFSCHLFFTSFLFFFCFWQLLSRDSNPYSPVTQQKLYFQGKEKRQVPFVWYIIIIAYIIIIVYFFILMTL